MKLQKDRFSPPADLRTQRYITAATLYQWSSTMGWCDTLNMGMACECVLICAGCLQIAQRNRFWIIWTRASVQVIWRYVMIREDSRRASSPKALDFPRKWDQGMLCEHWSTSVSQVGFKIGDFVPTHTFTSHPKQVPVAAPYWAGLEGFFPH